MSDTVEHIEARMRIEREKEKALKEEQKKAKKIYYEENLKILNYLNYLILLNKDQTFEDILNSYVLEGRLSEIHDSNYTIDLLEKCNWD